MVQKLLFSLLFLVFTAPFLLHGPAHAKDNKKDDEADKYRISLFPENWYEMSFFNNPRQSESIFTIRLFYHGVAAGCGHMKDLTSEKDQKRYEFKNGISTDIVNGTLKVLISQPTLVESDEDPRYTNYDCDIQHNESYVDLKLSRDAMIRKKIKAIGIKNVKTGDFGDFDIDINKERFIFKGKSPHGESWQTLWFFPKNTVILSAPKASAGIDVKEQIKTFAAARGLVPMENVLDGYKLPVTAHNYMYFNDPRGVYANKLNEEQNDLVAGTITATKTYYGPNGPQEEPYTLELHARLQSLNMTGPSD